MTATLLTTHLQQSLLTQQKLTQLDPAPLTRAAELLTETLRRGNKLLLCGNGGSAAQAQHIAAEFAGRYLRERPALPAIALTTDTSNLTAISNDYGFEAVFARQVEALGRPGDLLIGLSTSGNSANVLAAVAQAKATGLTTIGLVGEPGGSLRDAVDLTLLAPSNHTPHIQEAHLVMLHALCGAVEAALFPDKAN